jgi:hypothetical protein
MSVTATGRPILGGRQGLADGLPWALGVGASSGMVSYADSETLALMAMLEAEDDPGPDPGPGPDPDPDPPPAPTAGGFRLRRFTRSNT